MRRRKPDTMEIQQMKAQAKEEKQRRQIERKKFIREKKLREKAEHERYELEKRLEHLQDDMRMASDALVGQTDLKEFPTNSTNDNFSFCFIAPLGGDQGTIFRKESRQRGTDAVDRMQSESFQNGNGSSAGAANEGGTGKT